MVRMTGVSLRKITFDKNVNGSRSLRRRISEPWQSYFLQMRLLLPIKNRDRNYENKTSMIAGMMFRAVVHSEGVFQDRGNLIFYK